MDERIKELRTTLHMTQQAFADKLKIGRNNIAGYETGKRGLSDAVISLICKTFRVREDWLRNGEGEMFDEADTFSLDEYVAKRKFTELDKEFLKAYFDLDSDTRELVLTHFITRLSELPKSVPAAAPPRSVHDMTREEAHRMIDRQFDEEEADRKEGTSESSTGSRSASGAG